MPDRRGATRRDRRALGRRGEALAEAHLRRLGFRILARNLHGRHAELDLLALEGKTLCFVEVRSRRGRDFGSAAESIDRRKQRRLALAATWVLAQRRLPPHDALRFDVVAIDTSGPTPRVELIRDAFQLD